MGTRSSVGFNPPIMNLNATFSHSLVLVKPRSLRFFPFFLNYFSKISLGSFDPLYSVSVEDSKLSTLSDYAWPVI